MEVNKIEQTSWVQLTSHIFVNCISTWISVRFVWYWLSHGVRLHITLIVIVNFEFHNKTKQIRSKQNNTYKRKQKSTVQHMKKKWGDNCRNFPYVPFQFSNFIFITLMADRKRQSHWNFNKIIMKYGDKKKLILLAILWNFFYFYFYFHFYNFLFFYTYLFRFILI